ncbi:MAG: single-stranded DNA-binding protein [Eubacterium sp.]|nr:single-stranded DNA-binding protein [Eubacterium sp.]MDD7208479.1 single-stranded DNA-binding protein [Lachnospiraceae bacterium]MDY5497602.1 single-stranded DNA-binding protein [Anaerobutyricum sp.]
MNKVILMGRLTRNPDVRYSQGEKSTCVARYTLAVNRRFRREGDQDADFINCVAFGRQGEFAEKYLKQGTKIVISGRIQTGSYTNRDGVKVYTTDVVVEEQDFAESKAASANYNGSYQGNGFKGSVSEPQETQTNRPVPGDAVSDGFMTIPEGIEEELPFI